MSKPPKNFLKALEDIGGYNRFGEPRLILVHGTEARFHPNGPLKYITDRVGHREVKSLPNGLLEVSIEFTDIPLERWVIEEWVPPEFLLDHNQHRYGRDEHNREIDILGPFPARGKYRTLMILEDNEGKPIPLNDRLLTHLRQLKYETFDNIKHGETEAPTYEETAKYLQEYSLRSTKQQIALQKNIWDMVDDAFNPHLHRLTLANHKEGTQGMFRRGSTYNPHWDNKESKEKHESKFIN